MSAPSDASTSVTPYAALGTRVLALVVDAAVGTLVSALGMSLLIVGVASGSMLLPALGLLVIVGWVLALAWMVGARGATIGKHLLGIRIVDADSGQVIGIGRALLRQVVVGSLGILNLLQLVTLPRQPRRQGWHDLLARSVVVTAAGSASRVQPGAPVAGAARESALGIESTQVRGLNATLARPSLAGESTPTVPPPPSTAPSPSTSPEVVAPPAQATPPPPPSRIPPPPDGSGTPSPVAPAAIDPRPGDPLVTLDPDLPVEPVAPATHRWVLRTATGRRRDLDRSVMVGRDPDPSPVPDCAAWVVEDPDFTVSKTHALLGSTDGTPWVEDWHSTNGVRIIRAGDAQPALPHERVPLLHGDQISLGDFLITLENEA